jgi:hypothetical protein
VCGPICAVAFDLSVHLLIIATLGGRNDVTRLECSANCCA